MSKETYPVPCRFDLPERKGISGIHKATGISKAEIIRRCLRFALPKFQSGEANLLDFGRQDQPNKQEQG